MSTLLAANTRPSYTTTFQDSFSQEVWYNTYRDHNDKDINDTFWRVAKAIASVEITEELRKTWSENFYDMMTNFKVLPGGRILANAGTEFKGTTLVNCFVSPNVKYDIDSIGGILQTLKDQSLTLKSEGGWGHNFSALRPRGAFINGIGVETPGSVKFMELFDKSSEIITEGSGRKSSNKKAKGKIRKGAMMGVLDCWHPDIIEFITAKQTQNRLQKFNVSVNCVDKFMEKVVNLYELKSVGTPQEELDKITWDLIFPQTTHETYKSEWKGDIQDWLEKGYPVDVYKTVKVEWLWNLITQSTYNRNEPGILFLDRSNKFNQSNYIEKIMSTNPSMPAKTKVHTDKGIFNIEQLENQNFKVKSLDGIWADAKCIKSGKNKPLIELEFGNIFKTARSTKEHRWPVYDQRMDRIYKVNADELKIGDLIPVNRNETLGIRGDMTLTKEEGFFLGYFIGDGWFNERKNNAGKYFMGVTFGSSLAEQMMAETILKFINNRKKEKSSITRTKGGFDIQTTSIEFAKFLMERFGLKPGVKCIPEIVWKSNDEFIIGFIDGLLSSDGHVSKSTASTKCVDFITSRKDIALDYSKLLSFFGVNTGINYSSKPSSFPNKKNYQRNYDRYSVRISGNFINKFCNVFQITHPDKFMRLEKLSEVTSKLRCGRWENYVEITDIRDGGSEDVWDISVYHNQHVFPTDWCYTGNCGEQQLSQGNVCVLATLNLTQFVNETRTGFDLEKIKKYTKYLVRFLDNVNSYSDAPLPDYVDAMRKKRRIGAGLMGWGSALYMLKVRFGSKKADEIRSTILKAFTHAGVEASIDLAEEKGMFELCDPNKHVLSPYWDNIDLPVSLRNRMKKIGIRNSSLFSMQPNGNSSIFANIVSGGIEPIFLHGYIRTVIVGNIPEHMSSVTPLWYQGEWYETEMFKFVQEGDEQILRGIDTNNVVYKIDKNRGLTKEVLCQDYGVRYLSSIGEWDADADWAVTTENLTVNEHVDDLKGFAKAVDSACSKTVNLPNNYNFEDFQNIYLDAYKTGYIKGLTTYRAGSMTSVLSAVEQKDVIDEEVILTDIKMPDSSRAEIKILRDYEGGGKRKWYVTISLNENSAPIGLFVQTNALEKTVIANDAVDQLIILARQKNIPETFILSTIEKCLHDTNSTKIARAIGLLLRHGVRIKNIVSALDKVENVGFGSFVFQIKKLLSGYIKTGEIVEGQTCSECNGKLIYESGCQRCINCAASKCS